jgi:glycosyltransferase involved in cell wall biosynthesis
MGMERRTVVFISNTAWSFYKFRLKVIASFVNAGYRVVLLSAKDEYVEQLRLLGAEFYPLEKMEGKGKNPFKEIQLILEIAGWYKKIRPGIVFQYTIKPNIYGTFAAKLLGIKSICVVTGLGYTFLNKGLIPALAKKLYKLSFSNATEVWFLNNDDKNLFVHNKLVDAAKIRILPGEGIDCDAFNPAAVNVNTSETGRISFILVARLLYDKGVVEYVNAARIIKSKFDHVDFYLMGYLNVQNPSAISQEEVDVWENNGYVTYLGSKSDVRETIVMQDCVVLPSYREGMSMILLESAALRLPLIATNIAGCKEIIEDGVTGYLCKVRDAADLADKMEQFILLPAEERKIMGEKGRKKMLKEFDVRNIIHRYFESIEKHMHGPGASKGKEAPLRTV